MPKVTELRGGRGVCFAVTTKFRHGGVKFLVGGIGAILV